jgi:hypothetical protein
MPAGLQTWDEYGRLRLDTSVRMANFVGTLYTSGANGSTWTDTTKGTPFYFCIPHGTVNLGSIFPTVYFSGNTLIWTYPAGNPTTTNVPCYITYGYF